MEELTREQKMEEMIQFDVDMIISDPDVARQNFREILMDGCTGYARMTGTELDESYESFKSQTREPE